MIAGNTAPIGDVETKPKPNLCGLILVEDGEAIAYSKAGNPVGRFDLDADGLEAARRHLLTSTPGGQA
jgi:hypothetical protein